MGVNVERRLRNHGQGVIMNLVDKIIDYENGNLTHIEVLSLFQELVNTGMAWELRGSYGRTAMDLLKSGLIRAYN